MFIEPHKTAEADLKLLYSMGYAQELARTMKGFQNFAISFSIICIVSGGINSLGQGISGVGGAAIGIGWLLGCAVSLVFALEAHGPSLPLASPWCARAVPRGIVNSVLWSALAGWIMLSAFVLAIPDMDKAAASGSVCQTGCNLTWPSRIRKNARYRVIKKPAKKSKMFCLTLKVWVAMNRVPWVSASVRRRCNRLRRALRGTWLLTY